MSIKGLINTNYFDLNGASLHLNSTQDSTSSSTGSLIVSGGLYVEKNINNHGNIISSGVISGGSISVGTDDSTSTSTGAIVVPGGIGIGKSVYIGDSLKYSGDVLGGLSVCTLNKAGVESKYSNSSDNTYLTVSVGSNACAVAFSETEDYAEQNYNAIDESSVYVSKIVNGTISYHFYADENELYAAHKILGKDTSDSTSSTSGSLIISGGAGIEKNLYVGGNISASNLTTDSTSITLNMASGTNTGTYALSLYKIMNIVYLVGSMSDFIQSTISGNTVVTTSALPTGYRPSSEIHCCISAYVHDSQSSPVYTYKLSELTIFTGTSGMRISFGNLGSGFTSGLYPGGMIYASYII